MTAGTDGRFPADEVGKPDASETPPIIWLLEDSPLHARVLRASLGEGYRVEHFSDGAALLERLSAGGAPEVLVLDWELPGLAGIEVCRFVRQSRDELALPVLMHTGARNDPQGLLDALAAGVNDFVPKPCEPAEIQARVTTLVRVRRLHARSQEAERAHREALAALEREAVVRERFISILGHDLRSPLSAILTSAQMQRLALTDDGSPAARLVGVVERSGRRMARMIADLLDLARSRTEEGMPIVRDDADLVVLCRHAVEELAASEPGRRVEFDAGPEQHGRWDADRVEQVVGNLLSNALAYGRPGAPVRLSLRGDPASVTLEVNNEGEIAQGMAAGLFDPFRRGDGAGGRAARGLGLGLYIVHSIVVAHGGTVDGASADGVTTFRVTLPRYG